MSRRKRGICTACDTNVAVRFVVEGDGLTLYPGPHRAGGTVICPGVRRPAAEVPISARGVLLGT